MSQMAARSEWPCVYPNTTAPAWTITAQRGPIVLGNTYCLDVLSGKRHQVAGVAREGSGPELELDI